MHNKIYHVEAFAVGLAVAAEAVGGVRIVVDLHARCLVVMERAVQAAVFVCF